MNKKAKIIINLLLIAVLVVGLIIGNVILFRYEQEVNTVLSPPIIDEEVLEQSSSSGQALSKRIMEEGAVLLKNNDTLPLDYAANKQVNVFGWRSVDWIYGSEGTNSSGGVSPEDGDFEKNVDLYKALNAYGVQYNKRLYDMYHQFLTPNRQSANLKGVHIRTLVPLADPRITDKNYYSDDLLAYTENYSDTAIVVIGRMAGEAMNGSISSQGKRGPGAVDDHTRHFFELSSEEEALLTYCGQTFENVIVLLNVSNPFECGFLETIPGIDACMYLGYTGTRAASAVPSLLYGDMSPSGKTVDIFPYDAFTNPSNSFLDHTYTDNSRTYVDIVENIYIGYKWYETADVMGIWNGTDNVYGKGYDGVVQFPFGHGESYNTFEWTVNEFSIAPGSKIDDSTKISVTVSVKNTGEYVGRDVVEVYVTAPYTPNQIEKSFVSLVAFNKTNALNPGEEEKITIEIDAYDFISYDCYDKNGNGFKGYELEKGKYTIKLMTDSHTIKNVGYNGSTVPGAFDFEVEETIKIEKDPITGVKVGNLFTGEDAVDVTPIDANESGFTADIPWFTRTAFPNPDDFKTLDKARACTPSAKAYSPSYTSAKASAWDNATVDEFGDPVDTTPVIWGANNGKKLAENGVITELGKKLGADFYDPDWKEVLDQITISETLAVINKYYGTKAMASVGKPALTDLDGPAQIKGFSSIPRGTGYPTMVVVAATWNPQLAYELGKAYGDDMKAVGVQGVWGWAIDLHRGAFFGRNHESPSEDALLSGQIIMRAVKGLHTRGRYSFIKHFALYGYGGDSVWITEQGLRENYLKPFRAVFVEAGALGAMTTYQGIGAEHSETTVALLTGVLRKEWAFKGAITTDYIGNNSYCDAIIRSGGNLGMGVELSSGIATYNASSPVRLQRRLREAMHEVLYMWLRADYNEQQYLLNPDTGDSYTVASTIDSWSWWQPMIFSLDVTIAVGCTLWAGLVCISVFMKPNKRKNIEINEFEGEES